MSDGPIRNGPIVRGRNKLNNRYRSVIGAFLVVVCVIFARQEIPYDLSPARAARPDCEVRRSSKKDDRHTGARSATGVGWLGNRTQAEARRAT